MSVNVTEIFGSNVFSTAVMRERLPKKVFQEVMDVMQHGGNISMATADIVANAMKDWAVEKGATHYAHWFQPLTGVTAEKHDAFLTRREDGQDPASAHRQAADHGGARRLLLPLRRPAVHPLRPGLHRLGHDLPRLRQGDVLPAPSCASPPSSSPTPARRWTRRLPLLRSMEAISAQGLRILRLFGNTEAPEGRSPPWARSRSTSWWTGRST